MFTDNPDKQEAIRLGEQAGEEHVLALYAKQGIDALAATLKPRDFEGYAAAFYERWPGGDESWQEHARVNRLAVEAGADPYFYKAFDEVFARGARRCAEMLVRGYLDGVAGVPFAAPDGNSVEALKAQLALRQLRTRLGERDYLIVAYETGHRLATSEKATEVTRG